MDSKPELLDLMITSSGLHEDAIIEGDRSALSRLHIALGDLLKHNSRAAYARHFLDGDGEEFDVLLKLSDSLCPPTRRTIRVVDLSDSVHVGTLSLITICSPSWFQELQVMSERNAIDLFLPELLESPQPNDGALLVLGLERTAVKSSNDYAYAEAFGILPEALWPASDGRFDDFLGGLRSLRGRQIRWQTTISGTQDDPRLGRIIVQYETSNGDRRIELAREDSSVSRKVSVPRHTV